MEKLGSKENPFKNTTDIWRFSQNQGNRYQYIEFIYVSKQVVINPHLEIELKNKKIFVTIVD